MKITYQNETYTDDDMTAAHAILVANLVGQDTWAAIHPTNGPIGATAWLAVLHAARTGRNINDIADEINHLKLSELLDLLIEGG